MLQNRKGPAYSMCLEKRKPTARIGYKVGRGKPEVSERSLITGRKKERQYATSTISETMKKIILRRLFAGEAGLPKVRG